MSSIAHYEAHAAEYGTALLGHDTGDSRRRFLAAIAKEAADILDLGCGPGRDLKAFAAAGHRAVGLDGSPTLAAAARAYSGCPVWERDLADPGLPAEAFDGVFAQAVLFHVPTPGLPALLAAILATLRPGGVFYACDPTGSGEEGWVEDRHIALRRPQSWKRLARDSGLTLVEEWRRPLDAPRRQQTWLATLWRKA
ncbi:class I SAM-dependent methyltransferase [Aerophototrophica crusticola]|uniref:class I SAM-dependent methyltransferase n=1 Tax=Aerophototrophica crusticola TaxID=1709002 RepID=UPI000A54260C